MESQKLKISYMLFVQLRDHGDISVEFSELPGKVRELLLSGGNYKFFGIHAARPFLN